jgi:predicted DNA-binding protein YlxM (UPF0122 family)
MTVQELFKSIDRKEFIYAYLRNDNETLNMFFREDLSIQEIYSKVNFFKEVVLAAFDRFCEAEVERNEEYIVFAIPEYEGDTSAHSFLSLREEILNPETVERIEHYAYEFSPHEEILGYDVSEASRYEVGDDVTVALSIFNEMTFCGITEEHHKEKVEEITQSLKEAEESIENGTAECRPIEDLFKELGWEDTRTREEKDFSLAIAKIQGNAYVQTLNKYFEMEKYYILRKGEEDAI